MAGAPWRACARARFFANALSSPPSPLCCCREDLTRRAHLPHFACHRRPANFCSPQHTADSRQIGVAHCLMLSLPGAEPSRRRSRCATRLPHPITRREVAHGSRRAPQWRAPPHAVSRKQGERTAARRQKNRVRVRAPAFAVTSTGLRGTRTAILSAPEALRRPSAASAHFLPPIGTVTPPSENEDPSYTAVEGMCAPRMW